MGWEEVSAVAVTCVRWCVHGRSPTCRLWEDAAGWRSLLLFESFLHIQQRLCSPSLRCQQKSSGSRRGTRSMFDAPTFTSFPGEILLMQTPWLHCQRAPVPPHISPELSSYTRRTSSILDTCKTDTLEKHKNPCSFSDLSLPTCTALSIYLCT